MSTAEDKSEVTSSRLSDQKTEGQHDATKRVRPIDALSIREVSSLPMVLLVGHDGRYELIREIGRGGYGIVYLAYDTQLNRQVAIKIARPEMVSDEAGIERFRRESRAAATLEHPGIIPVFDCGDDGQVHFYVMPFLDCENLAQWLVKQKEPLSERVAAQLLLDITEAIEFGHQQGIIHRDLKPQNILLKNDPTNPNGFRPVVLDFGLCGLVESGNTSTSMLAGTPRYMSPEQAMFGSRRITERSDVYSLGVILYQLLTGNPPHQPQSISEAVLMLHTIPVESPRSSRPDLTPAMESICLKCLRKDYDRRYDSALSLAKDLRSFLNGSAVVARPEGLWERIDFAIRFGEWESRLGFVVIALNAASILWAVIGSLTIGSRFPSDPNVIAGISQLLTFLGLVAFPIHSLGMYAGWVMTKRTPYTKRLAFGTLISFIWAVDLWINFRSEEVFLRIYRDQGYVQIMVFLLLASAFTIQTICLAAGTWASHCRKQESIRHAQWDQSKGFSAVTV